MLTYRSDLLKFDKRVWLFIAVWGFVAFAYFGVISVLLNLYLLRLGFGVEYIGLLIGMGQLIWAAAAFPSIAIGARIGLRRALIIALAISALGSALLLLVEGLPAALRPFWLLFCWGLVWLGASLNTVSSLPYLAGITQTEHRNYAFAIRQAVIALLTIVGSLIAGVLPGFIAARMDVPATDPAPYRIALLLVPVCFAVASVLMMATPPAVAQPQPRMRRTTPLPRTLLLMFGLVAILATSSEGPLRAFYNVYMSEHFHLPTSQIGLVVAGANMLAVFGILLTPKLMNRIGTAKMFALTVFFLGLSLLFISMVPTVTAGIVGFIMAWLAISAMVTARAPFSQEIVEEQLRPTTSAILTLVVALGWGITAIISGLAIISVGYSGVFIISAGLAFVSATLALIYFVRLRQVPAAQAVL